METILKMLVSSLTLVVAMMVKTERENTQNTTDIETRGSVTNEERGNIWRDLVCRLTIRTE